MAAPSKEHRQGNGQIQSLTKRQSTFINLPLSRLRSGLQGVSGKFKYHQLGQGEIRVLCLRPGEFGAPLHCRIKHIQLDSLLVKPKSPLRRLFRIWTRALRHYEAISYTWGRLVFEHELHVEGGKVLRITQSLFDALQHLRLPYRERKLWADAVCINQFDDDEKAAQVRIMGTVFKSALSVLVWVAPKEVEIADDSHDAAQVDIAGVRTTRSQAAENMENAAFAALTALDENPSHFQHPEPYNLAQLAQCLALAERCNCCRKDVGVGQSKVETYIRAICGLLSRPFFSRMWIIQEVRSASSIKLCVGKHRVPWKNLVFMLSVLHNILLHGENDSSKVHGHLQDYADKLYDLAAVFLPQRASRHDTADFTANSVLSHMCAFSSFLCRDPRDRVFAVRPVLQIEGEKLLEPNYDLAPHEVFRRLVYVCMTQSGSRKQYANMSFEFLALVGTEHSRIPDSPSWVPNFDSFTGRSRYKHRQYTCPAQYAHAAPFKAFPPAFKASLSSPLSTQLHIRGRVIGSVHKIWRDCSGPKLNNAKFSGPAETAAHVTDWYDKCRMAVSSLTPDEAQHARLLTLITRGYADSDAVKREQDQSTELISTAAETAVNQSFHGAGSIGRGDHVLSVSFILREIWMSQGRKALQGLEVLVDPRQLFGEVKLESGDTIFGWLPKDSLEDDNLCVLPGAPYPFVLRSDRQGKFCIVGDAYTEALTWLQVFGAAHTLEMEGTHGRRFDDWQAVTNDQRYEAFCNCFDWITII